MASFRRDIPAEGLRRVDVELWRGNIAVRPASAGEVGYVESGWDLEITSEGDTLYVRHPVDIRRPLDLADLIGEQQIRIEVEGTVLFDRQIRHGGGDVEIVLPSCVRDISCRTPRGDVYLRDIGGAAEAYTDHGNVLLSGGSARITAGTSVGDVKAIGWRGLIHVRTAKGNLDLRDIRGDVDARTGKGEIRIEVSRAKVNAQTGHGDVVASGISGESILSTGHGDVVATDIDGARLEAATNHGKIVLEGRLDGGRIKNGYGDINCRLTAAEGGHEMHTGKGNINLDLDEAAAVRIDASTRHGSIRSNLPLVRVGNTGPEGYFNQRMVGTTAGGNPAGTITLNTKSGDIRIVRREAAGATAGVAPVKESTASQEQPAQDRDVLVGATPPSPNEHSATGEVKAPPAEEVAAVSEPGRASELELEVLAALARNEISVDEAMVLIEKIRPKRTAAREIAS